MKKSTKLVSAVVVLAVLGGVYMGLNTYVSKEEKTESSEEKSKTKVFSVKTDDIKSLEFIVDKKDVTFEKKDDSWVKKDETAFPVNQTTLDSAASAIETVEADRVLEDVEDLTEYGLDSPSNTVTVDTADGITRLNIGDENTSTNQYYISKDDDDSTVYVVAADTVSPFMDSLYDYAQGEDFPTIDSSTVKKVQVSENKDSYVLEENSDGATWNVSGDGSSDKESADTTAAGNVTSGLGSFAFDQFVNYNAEDLSQYGLDKPYATITVDYKEEVKDDSTDSTESGENDSTASESDSESNDTTDTDSSSEDADSKTTTVDKQLVIYVGDEAGDGSRYVTVDNKQIYTMSTDTLSAVIDKMPSDLWSLIVNYLSVKNLDPDTVKAELGKYDPKDYYESFNEEMSRWVLANKGRYHHINDEAREYIQRKASKYENDDTCAMFVSFSGGKDSTVVSDLVRKALSRPDIIHIFGNTTLEFPETYKYIERFKRDNRKTPLLRAENKDVP